MTPRARVGVFMVGAAVVATASACPVYGAPDLPDDDDGASSGGAGGAVHQGGNDEPSCEELCPQIGAPPCYEGVCDDLGGCTVVVSAPGTPCDDDAFCTVDDVCNDIGDCKGVANDCGLTAEICEAVVCDEARMSCSVEPFDPCR